MTIPIHIAWKDDMQRSFPLMLLILLAGCSNDPAELPRFTPFTWHTLIEEGTPPRAVQAFDGDGAVVVGDAGSVTWISGGAATPETPQVTSDLVSVWGTHPDSTWTVGDDGVILCNVGGPWVREISPTTADLAAVDGTSADRVFAVGNTGRLLERRNGSWLKHTPAGAVNLIGVACTAAEVFMLDVNGQVLQWLGGDEKAVLPDAGIGPVADIAAAGDGLWAVGPDGTAAWDGSAWNRDPDLPFGGSALALVGGRPCVIGDYVWLRLESYWVEYPAPTASALTAAAGTSDGALFVLQTSGALHRRDGAQWTALIPTAIRPIRDIAGAAADDWFAVGGEGLFVHWNGVELLDVGVASFEPRGLWAASADSVFCVGDGGRAFLGSSAGWTETPTGVGADLLAVWGRSAREVYAVGAGQVVLRWDGSAWSRMDSPTSAFPLVAVGGRGDGRLFVLDGAGTLWSRRQDVKEGWTFLEIPWSIPGLARLLFVDDETMIMAGPQGALSVTFRSDVTLISNFGLADEILDLARGPHPRSYGLIGRNGLHMYYDGSWDRPSVPWPDHDHSAINYWGGQRKAAGTPLGGLAVYGP